MRRRVEETLEIPPPNLAYSAQGLRHAQAALAVWRELGRRRSEAMALHSVAQLQMQDLHAVVGALV